MKATLIVALYGICATTLLTFYSVYQWLDPMTPLLIGAIAVIIPSLGIVFALEEDARPPNPNVMLLVQTLLVAGIFGIAVPALWNVPGVRTETLESFGTRKAVERGLLDRNELVRASACKKMFDPALEFRSDQVGAVLYAQPTAAECIKQAPQGRLGDDVATSLVLAWHQSLLSREEDACNFVPVLDMMPISSSNRAAILLDCSLQSESPQSRQCCSDYLATAYPGEKLYSEVRGGSQLVMQFGTTAFLLASSFGEKVFSDSVAPVPSKLRLTTEPYRQLSAELACTVVTTEERAPNEMRYLEWLFRENAGCLPPDASENIDVLGACHEFLTFAKADKSDLGAALCSADLAVRKRSAALAQRRRTGEDLSQLAPDIALGQARVQSERLSTEQLQKMGEVGSGGFQSMTPDQHAHFLARAQQHGQQVDHKPKDRTQMEVEANAVKSKNGREDATDKYNAQRDDGDLVKALGVTSEDLAAAMKDGELSDEMKEKIANKRRNSKKSQ